MLRKSRYRLVPKLVRRFRSELVNTPRGLFSDEFVQRGLSARTNGQFPGFRFEFWIIRVRQIQKREFCFLAGAPFASS